MYRTQMKASPVQHIWLIQIVLELICVVAGEAASRLQVQQSSGSMAG